MRNQLSGDCWAVIGLNVVMKKFLEGYQGNSKEIYQYFKRHFKENKKILGFNKEIIGKH